MKLRFRSVETKETIRVDVPPSSTLQELKHRLCQSLSGESLNSADSIRLSLNNKDELRCSSPDETIQMLGIASGDLIYFDFNNPVVGESKSLISPVSSSNLIVESTMEFDSINANEKTLELISNSPAETTRKPDFTDPNEKTLELISNSPVEMTRKPDFTDPNEKTLELTHQGHEDEGSESGEMDWEEDDSGSVSGSKLTSIPGFLRKVLMEELRGDDGSRDHKLLLISVHAVLLESGFVRFDPISRKKISSFGTILCYTLPEIVDGVSDQNSDVVHTVDLKIQTLGKFVIVYGTLSGSSSVKSVKLNEEHLVPFLNVAWSDCGLFEQITLEDGNLPTSPEKEVFNFWRAVKDELALPLLIDLCEKAGFGLPPCFMRLPTELKLKILESLPGVDLAKMSCASSELHYMASNDDLWKEKFVEQFGNADRFARGVGHWKQKFARAWENRKKRKRIRRRVSGPWGHMGPPFRGIPWQPRIIGDREPFAPPFDNAPPFPNFLFADNRLGMRLGGVARHVPRCNLGEPGTWEFP